MPKDNFVYSGKENLENSEVMRNFQKYLTTNLDDFLQGENQVLDFGAGSGIYSKLAKNLGKEVLCVERDSEYQKNLAKLGFSSYGSIEEVPNKLNRIFTINVLEHIEDDLTELKKLLDKLDPGGKIFIFVPAGKNIYSKFDENVGHFRRYNKKELKTKLEEAGFKIEKLKYFDWVGYYCNLLFKYFGSDSGIISERKRIIYDKYLFPISKNTNFLSAIISGKNLLAIASKNT